MGLNQVALQNLLLRCVVIYIPARPFDTIPPLIRVSQKSCDKAFIKLDDNDVLSTNYLYLMEKLN